MQLTPLQKREIYENGCVHLPGVIPPEMVRAARRAINHHLGEEGMNKADLPEFRSRTYCDALTQKPVILDMFNRTPLFALAESALGPGTLRETAYSQIALRFPSMDDAPHPPGAHIDGTYAPLNGVTPATISTSTFLAAVFLSDVPEINSGNFTVWPGAHRTLEAHLRAHGHEVLVPGLPKIDLPEPRQIVARAGDAVLAHYQLPHGAACNLSPNIRYAVFFRVSHVDHAAFGNRILTDIWAEWAGVREV
jgi:hypothetical protein